jgi:hypothetical protein
MAASDRVSDFVGARDLVYRPQYARMLGSVTAALLLRQVAFWSDLKRGDSFYKFNSPCKHRLYINGDSWEEELGFSRSELDGARAKIGTKITKDGGFNKEDVLLMDTAFFDEDGVMTNANRLVIYWTDASRVTHYVLNRALLADALEKFAALEAQRKEKLMQKTCNSYCRKPALPGNAENLHYLITENTTENTTDTNNGVGANDTRRAAPAKIEPQPAQPAPVAVKSSPASSQQAVLFDEPPVERARAREAAPRPRDALWDAITEVWPVAEGHTAKIRQQLLGKIPRDKPAHVCNFDVPATPEEVRAFAEWYATARPRCDLPLRPESIQTHFYAFRREQAAQEQAGMSGYVYVPGLGYQPVAA